MKTQHEKDYDEAARHELAGHSPQWAFAAGAAHGRKQVIARLRGEAQRDYVPAVREFLSALTDLMEIVFK